MREGKKERVRERGAVYLVSQLEHLERFGGAEASSTALLQYFLRSSASLLDDPDACSLDSNRALILTVLC